MATLFISDLHLHPSRAASIDAFLDFLGRHRGKAEALYILGDLFETWVGDDHPEPAYQPVKTALRACNTAGTPVCLMHGNRDFMLAQQFATETGCTLIADPTRIDLYGTAALLMHGDSLCTDDKDYQRLRAQVRDPDWQQQARELPVKQRMEMAEQARELSALSKQGKDEYIMDVNQDEVRRVMTEQDVTLLIHGHTHRPGEHSFSNGTQQCTRIVLGDWYNKGSVLTVNQQHRQLQTLEL